MSKKKEKAKAYKVVCGFDTGDDGTRYEIGDDYFASNHTPEVTDALLEMNCLEESE